MNQAMSPRRIPRKQFTCLAALVAMAAVQAVGAGAHEASDDPQPPIAIPLELPADGYVTLVIEDEKGNRVRNLVSETFFKAGNHTVYWDGMDDRGRANIGPHGNYTTTGSIVAPGNYRVRGIRRDRIDLVYEFTPYNPVNPPWRTAGGSGQWLADHTPPSSVLHVPGADPFLLIGSSLAEGAHGLVWTDLNGKKIRGVQGIGGGWAGAVRLTRDVSGQPPEFIAYGLGASRHGEISLVGIGERSNKTLFARQEQVKHQATHYIVDYPVGGLAVDKGLAAISYPAKNEIAFVRIDPDKTLESPSFTAPATHPQGLAFDARGRLLVVEGRQVKRYRIEGDKLAGPETLVARDLDDPRQIMVGPDGRLFITDHGQSHQVKVFSPEGKFLYAIGRPGAPACGPYDETKMHYPMGMTLTPSGELWVAEEDYQPKRVSVWTQDGKFKKAFYGPTEYGGGGKIDPMDPTRFYYFGMEFKLDWEKGTDRLVHIFYRRDDPGNIAIPDMKGNLAGNPETPVYLNGQQYLSNIYTAHTTQAPRIAGLWIMENGRARLVAAVGQANYWDLFRQPEFQDKIPAGIDLQAPTNLQWEYDRPPYENALIFAWSDLNNDRQIQVEEVQFLPGKIGGLNHDDQLNFYTADGLKIAVDHFTAAAVPVYDLQKAGKPCPLGVPLPHTVVIPGRNGDFAVHGSAELEPSGKAFGSVSGVTRDGGRWYYPNQWMGLHASQSYPIDRAPRPGEIIGTTKVIGPTFAVADGAEELWALNANSGQIYLFTIDGLFVASLFKHGYFSDPYPARAERGLPVNDHTSDGEGFWQTVTATKDGAVYLQAINHTSSIIRVDGLGSIRRLPERVIEVSAGKLDECLEWFSHAERARQSKEGKKKARVGISSQSPTVDGGLTDWTGADWLPIDDRTWGSLKLADGKLYAAWKTLHQNLPENSGADPWPGMFKTGGGLDLMISTSGNSGAAPQPGDQRLLISKVNGSLRAVHYEQRSNRSGNPGEIASPNRTVKFDHIADVSDRVKFAEAAVDIPYRDTNVVFGGKIQMRRGSAYEVAIPLELLGLEATPRTITGDIGVLLGDGSATTKRVFWSNKNTSMVFDAPEESLLKPGLWGDWELVAEKTVPFRRGLEERGQDVEILSHGMGRLAIDSSKVKLGEPSAVIDWEGQGGLSNRAIGRGGYVIFRPQAEGWQDADTPLVNLGPDFGFAPHHPGRFKDGLYAGAKSNDLFMFLDGQNIAGSRGILGGALWSKQTTPQFASWDIQAGDEKTHQFTVVFGSSARQTLHLAPLGDPENKRTIAEFEGSEGLSVVQFNFSGAVRLTLEQSPYTEEDIQNNRPPAGMTAIFID